MRSFAVCSQDAAVFQRYWSASRGVRLDSGLSQFDLLDLVAEPDDIPLKGLVVGSGARRLSARSLYCLLVAKSRDVRFEDEGVRGRAAVIEASLSGSPCGHW